MKDKGKYGLEECSLLECVADGSCNNRRFGESYRFHYQGEKISELRTMLAVAS
jgi:hypothetical protein